LVIEESGPGIAAKDADRIFEPLFAAKKDVGTGLGLWVTKEIFERHGGSIHLHPRSDGGRGAAFTILLPRTAEVPRGVLEQAQLKWRCRSRYAIVWRFTGLKRFVQVNAELGLQNRRSSRTANVPVSQCVEGLLAEMAQHQGSPGPEVLENAVSQACRSLSIKKQRGSKMRFVH
jgi:hypothetical protein